MKQNTSLRIAEEQNIINPTGRQQFEAIIEHLMLNR